MEIIAECKKFQDDNADDIENGFLRSGNQWEHAGLDFLYTRNGDGCGFWDGDWEDAAGERLTAATKRYKPAYAYLADDDAHGVENVIYYSAI